MKALLLLLVASCACATEGYAEDGRLNVRQTIVQTKYCQTAYGINLILQLQVSFTNAGTHDVRVISISDQPGTIFVSKSRKQLAAKVYELHITPETMGLDGVSSLCHDTCLLAPGRTVSAQMAVELPVHFGKGAPDALGPGQHYLAASYAISARLSGKENEVVDTELISGPIDFVVKKVSNLASCGALPNE
jgi:hypothetical protein